MSAFPRTIPVKLDADGRIDVDIQCHACGYNLRMQPLAAGCPECGEAIEAAGRDDADRLDRADPRWLARVRRGARWLHGGAWAAMPLGFPGLVWGAAALWLLTVREPGRPETWMARGTRLSARWASVAAAVAGTAAAVLLVTRYGGLIVEAMKTPEGQGAGIHPLLRQQRVVVSTLFGEDWTAFDLLLCTASASMAVAMLEAWRHLFKLAARADAPVAARRCREAWKRYLLGVGVVVALALGTNIVERFELRLPAQLYEWTALILVAVVGTVVLGIWWVTVRLTRSLVDVLG